MSANDLTRCSTLLQLFLEIALRAAVAVAAVELRLFDLGMAENLQKPKKCRCLKTNGISHPNQPPRQAAASAESRVESTVMSRVMMHDDES